MTDPGEPRPRPYALHAYRGAGTGNREPVPGNYCGNRWEPGTIGRPEDLTKIRGRSLRSAEILRAGGPWWRLNTAPRRHRARPRPVRAPPGQADDNLWPTAGRAA